MLCGLGACWSTFVLKQAESGRLKRVGIPQLDNTNKYLRYQVVFLNCVSVDGAYRFLQSDKRLLLTHELHVSLSILIAFIFRMKKWYIKVVGPA